MWVLCVYVSVVWIVGIIEYEYCVYVSVVWIVGMYACGYIYKCVCCARAYLALGVYKEMRRDVAL